MCACSCVLVCGEKQAKRESREHGQRGRTQPAEDISFGVLQSLALLLGDEAGQFLLCTCRGEEGGVTTAEAAPGRENEREREEKAHPPCCP